MKEVDFRGKEAAWIQLFHVIRDQFPHCRMYGARVSGGAVVSYDRMQYTRIFSREEAPKEGPGEVVFNDQWRRFVRFCQEMEEVVLPEVHFRDGNPCSVHMERSGGAGQVLEEAGKAPAGQEAVLTTI